MKEDQLTTALTARIAELVPGVMPDINNLKVMDRIKTSRQVNGTIDATKMREYRIIGKTGYIDYEKSCFYTVQFKDGDDYYPYHTMRHPCMVRDDAPLPRDPTLADVMRALKTIGSEYYINPLGTICHFPPVDLFAHPRLVCVKSPDGKVVQWDFSAPLPGQDFDFKRWLAGVLRVTT